MKIHAYSCPYPEGCNCGLGMHYDRPAKETPSSGSERRPCSASSELAANDAARITQPDYNDLWQAYVAGARSGQKHPKADDYWLNRAADGYCKLVHATKDPEHFAAMGQSGQNVQAVPTAGVTTTES